MPSRRRLVETRYANSNVMINPQTIHYTIPGTVTDDGCVGHVPQTKHVRGNFIFDPYQQNKRVCVKK